MKAIHWVSANALIEHQTREIARIYKRSMPTPSNRRMGFTGEDERPRRRLNTILKSDRTVP